MKKLYPIILILAFQTTTSFSQKRFSKAQLQQDVDTLEHILQTSHPALYRSIDSVKAKKMWMKVSKELKDSLTEIEFLNIISPAISQYDDAHTFISAFDSEALSAYSKKGGKFFPINVWMSGQKLYVKDNTTSTIPAGAEILSINNITSSKIYSDMLYRGIGDTEKGKIISNQRLFKVMFWQLYGGENFKIIYKNGSKKTEIILA